ncbi:MAG TPA: cytochrome C oxidase subunit IV family protein [Anaerolineales bacterium]|nr:cytochrome C oxidase subunit IV family protein [Anaerolineales bacterium]
MDEKRKDILKEAYRVGAAVFILLMVLTIGEFFIGSIAFTWSWPLWGISILKAVMIIRDYMHLPRLFSGEEEAR